MIRACAKGLAVFATIAATGHVASQDTWSYQGANGPSNWSSQAPACAGAMQSPIIIEGTEPVAMHRLQPLYNVTPVSTKNGDQAVSLSYADGSILLVGAKTFMLKELTFRTPAEHGILDQTFPMEIQLRHESARGEIAMISVLVKEGRASLSAEELLPHLPLEPGQKIDRPNVKVNARDFMPHSEAYFRYMGSLTTPPCSEGVSWYVMKQPVEFSAQQIAMIKGLVGENARPPQPRNNRIILDARPQ